MKPFTKRNQRVCVWLMALLFCAMSVPSRAIWTCLNGVPCSMKNCVVETQFRPATSVPPAVCSHCSDVAPPVAISPLSTPKLHGATTCILRLEVQPPSVLTEGASLYLPLLALPPPVFAPCIPTSSSPLVFVQAVLSLWECRLSSPSGRSPPFFA